MAQVTANVVKIETLQTTINNIPYRYQRVYIDKDFVTDSITGLDINNITYTQSALIGYADLDSTGSAITPLTTSASSIGGSNYYRGPYKSGTSIVGDGFSGGGYRNCVAFIMIITDNQGRNELSYCSITNAYYKQNGAAYSPPTSESFGYISCTFDNISAGNVITWTQNLEDVASWWVEQSEIIPEPPTDPYAQGGTSTTGGGTGDFDGTTAAVDFPSGTPTAGAGNSGFIKLFNPSAANLTALAAYLWGTFDISSFKSIYNNPIDCIVALIVVPVQPTTGTAATISLGNIATNVFAPVISDQFVIFDCGSININEYWGAYLDYDPYTKCEIYLPYIGVQDIDINDIQGKTIQLKYYIDVLSGACVAMLKAGEDILYTWSGQCAAEIPITSTGFGTAFQTALSAANAIGETIVNAMSGIPQSLSLVASSVFNGARSKVHKSGSIGSMAGHMGIQKPYLIITRPVQSVPENLNEITGYPSNITATLGDLSGYTEIDTIHLSGIPATSEEMAEIEELLKGGVFI